MDANQGRDEDINVASFDLLDCPDVQVCQFREPLLSDIAGRSLPADIRSDLLKLTRKKTAKWHAPLGRVNLLERNGALGRNRPMTSAALRDLIEAFNQKFDSKVRSHPCFSGTLKGTEANCERVARHILPPRTSSNSPSWVISRIDDWSEGKDSDDYEVVVAVGINYGQKVSIPAGPIFDKTGMRQNLEDAFTLLPTQSRTTCFYGDLPRKDRYHLVAFNFFPWLTTSPWSQLDLNRIEEALLIYCFGYLDFAEALETLLDTVKVGDGKVTWLVFHGANNAVPALGTAFSQTLDPVKRPDILFCDNLAWKVTNNSVVLCRPEGRSDLDKLSVDE